MAGSGPSLTSPVPPDQATNPPASSRRRFLRDGAAIVGGAFTAAAPLPGMLYEIQGFAWSGRGRVTAVDVSVDGGLVPADAVMDATSLPKVQMPNRSGFIVDDRPDTRAVRCMQNCR
jgi:hypothetical protein